MAALVARDMMLSGQYYKITFLAASALDEMSLIAAIGDEGSADPTPLYQLFAWSPSDAFFDTENVGNGYRTTWAVRMKRNVLVGDYMLFLGRVAGQIATVYHGEISGANTPLGHVAEAPRAIAESVTNIFGTTVRSVGNAVGGIPKWLALTAGLVLASVAIWKFKS